MTIFLIGEMGAENGAKKCVSLAAGLWLEVMLLLSLMLLSTVMLCPMEKVNDVCTHVEQ